MVKCSKENQIKSKERVAKHGEVFTSSKEVNAMLALVGDDVNNITSTVLEPAVGEGAFLTEILNRRLVTISQYDWSQSQIEWMVLRAVSSLYGVDIQSDNVRICRKNLMDIATAYCAEHSHSFEKLLRTILAKNVICGDSLSATANNGCELKFPEWTFNADYTIVRHDYSLRELLENGGECNAPHRKYTYRFCSDSPMVFKSTPTEQDYATV